MVLVDSNSGWFEVVLLRNMSSTDVISKLKCMNIDIFLVCYFMIK